MTSGGKGLSRFRRVKCLGSFRCSARAGGVHEFSVFRKTCASFPKKISTNLDKSPKILPNIPKYSQISPNLPKSPSVLGESPEDLECLCVRCDSGMVVESSSKNQGSSGRFIEGTQTIPSKQASKQTGKQASKQSDARSFGESNGRFISGTIIRFATLDERFDNEPRERDAKRRGLQQTFIYMQRGGL